MNLKGLMLLSRFCLKEEGGGGGQEFRSLEVRRKLIGLKNAKKKLGGVSTVLSDSATPTLQNNDFQGL